MKMIKVLDSIPSKWQTQEFPSYTDLDSIKEGTPAKKTWFKAPPSLVYILKVERIGPRYGKVHWTYVDGEGRIGTQFYVTTCRQADGEPFLKINPFWHDEITNIYRFELESHPQYFENL